MSLYRNALSRVCSLMCVAGFGVGILAAPVAAQVVYDGGSPIQTNAFVSEFISGLSAETFTFDSLTNFNTVEWYGIYAAPSIPAADNFTIIFFDTTAGVPNDTPIAGLTFTVGNAVNRNATGLMVAGSFPEFAYSSSLPGGVSLPAGTYGILIGNDVQAGWHWEVTDAATGIQHFDRRSMSDPWRNNESNLSFRLLNVASGAPEPGSLALFSLAGLPLVGAIIRRRRSA
jgi:hypothetical protein